MKDKKDLVEAYLDISPAIFSVQQENNRLQRDLVNLNDRVVQFVREINIPTSMDEMDTNDNVLNQTKINRETLDGTTVPSQEQTSKNNNYLLKEYMEVFVQANKQDMLGATSHVLNAMKFIEKTNKVSGSVSSERKFKSLNARWMTKPNDSVILVGNEQEFISSNYLQRDVIVRLSLSKNSQEEGYFRIIAVYTKFYNKWYINPDPKCQKDYEYVTWKKSFPKSKVKVSARMIYFHSTDNKVHDSIPSCETEAKLMFRMEDAHYIKGVIGKIN